MNKMFPLVFAFQFADGRIVFKRQQARNLHMRSGASWLVRHPSLFTIKKGIDIIVAEMNRVLLFEEEKSSPS